MEESHCLWPQALAMASSASTTSASNKSLCFHNGMVIPYNGCLNPHPGKCGFFLWNGRLKKSQLMRMLKMHACNIRFIIIQIDQV